jgi:Lar family restriction alleviation protein
MNDKSRTNEAAAKCVCGPEGACKLHKAVICSKCGQVDDSGLTPRTNSAAGCTHDWQAFTNEAAAPDDAAVGEAVEVLKPIVEEWSVRDAPIAIYGNEIKALATAIAALTPRDDPAAATDGTLLPCPFCGGEASAATSGGGVYWVFCSRCKAQVDWHHTSQEVADTWNRRADLPPAVVRRIEEAFAGRVKAALELEIYSDEAIKDARHDGNHHPHSWNQGAKKVLRAMDAELGRKGE